MKKVNLFVVAAIIAAATLVSSCTLENTSVEPVKEKISMAKKHITSGMKFTTDSLVEVYYFTEGDKDSNFTMNYIVDGEETEIAISDESAKALIDLMQGEENVEGIIYKSDTASDGSPIYSVAW